MSLPPLLYATYRLQLQASFGFDAAIAVVPYLASLGVSHLYLSPIWAARPGSSHGYDVVDHTAINPELGGPEGLERLVEAARAHGLGLVLDCVPNHMGIGYDNPWWADVLTWGEGSPFAGYFDVDWSPAEPTLAGRVLLPVLGDHYGRVLEDGLLVPGLDGGGFVVRYFEHTVPLHPREAMELLDAATAEARRIDATDATDVLADLAATAKLISRRRERVSRQRRRADRDRAAQIETRLAEARAKDPLVETALTAALAHYTPKSDGDGDGRAADRLHRLLERQAYRLAFWRLASHEINYRRFFDINDLAGLRMEEPALFDAAHRTVVSLVAEGKVQGLRLDHIDGLFDPQAYLTRLRRHARHTDGNQVTLHVEKILGPDEQLRQSWPVDGTTGYEALTLLHGVQIDPEARRPLLTLYRDLSERGARFAPEAIAAKRLIMQTSLAAELNVLAGDLNRIAKRSRLTRDYARPSLREALANVVAHFPVYRTYVDGTGADDTDRAVIALAVARARRAAATADRSVYDFIEGVLTTAFADAPPPGLRPHEVRRFARRFQQYTGPVTAKAVEDTSFYRWVPWLSANEVGGEPEHLGVTPEAFHKANADRLAHWPRALVATATHDHKRGEDTRARLAVLSERVQTWSRAVRRWHRLAEPLRAMTEDGPAPSANDLYLFFQIAVGAWPLGLETSDAEGLAAWRARLRGYMEKAIREAKERTSWAVQDRAYEAAVRDFVDAVLDPEQAPRLLEELRMFAADLDAPGAVNGLAQTVLKLTVPGVPDIYQGTEGWDQSLVDPDNRRPVDYARLARDLDALGTDRSGFEAVVASWLDGRLKQAVIGRLLALRRDDPALFLEGDYRPLEALGRHAAHVLAFARVHEDRALVVAVPRLVADRVETAQGLRLDWDDTAVQAPATDGAAWRCAFRSEPLPGDGRFQLARHATAPPVLVALAAGA